MPDLYFTVFSSKKLYDRPIFVRCVFHSHAVEIRLRAVITIDLEKGRIFVRPLLLKRLTMQRCHRQVIIGQSHAFELPKIVSNSKSNRSCNRRFTIDKNGSPLLRFRKQRVTFNTAQLQKNSLDQSDRVANISSTKHLSVLPSKRRQLADHVHVVFCR